MRAVYSLFIRDDTLYGFEDGDVGGKAGDCYILMPIWGADGTLESKSIHQYGSAITVPESPHYADQVPLFVRLEMKDVWMDEAVIRENLGREYRPGE